MLDLSCCLSYLLPVWATDDVILISFLRPQHYVVAVLSSLWLNVYSSSLCLNGMFFVVLLASQSRDSCFDSLFIILFLFVTNYATHIKGAVLGVHTVFMCTLNWWVLVLGVYIRKLFNYHSRSLYTIEVIWLCWVESTILWLQQKKHPWTIFSQRKGPVINIFYCKGWNSNTMLNILI